MTPNPVPPYPPAITHVGGDTYFLAWSEGQSPGFRLWGVFVTLN